MPSLQLPRYSPTLLPVKETSTTSSSHKLSASTIRPIEFNLVIESPPLICYGSRTQSTGALLSGLLFLYVNAYTIAMKSVTLELVQEVTVKRPSIGACKNCIHHVNVLKRWDLLKHDTTLPRSEYGYPFSHLLHGDLPASTSASLAGVSYYLRATATPLAKDVAPITLTRALPVYRSIITSDVRRCLRVFPPTALNVTASLPAVAFPKSTFTMDLQLNNVVNKDKNTRWQLRKFSWRLDEITRLKHTGCDKHPDSPQQLEDVKTIAFNDVRKGWKSDFSNDGRIDTEVEISTLDDVPMSCNILAPEFGFEVEHMLIVEMLVSEEHIPPNGSHQSTPTGAARILRMQFAVEIAERGGLGISWDDEVPPTYDDVPISPPGYDYIVPTRDIEHLVM
ncbi:hypothetical protein V1517DRAFT_12219 [Lipomyces orientalis]|uniref:Uncharacterized protein n=1 Tax=Lipomyces orientalis TaxID=1233043 RepID=A0ACC3TVZ9_9ASCO